MGGRGSVSANSKYNKYGLYTTPSGKTYAKTKLFDKTGVVRDETGSYKQLDVWKTSRGRYKSK